MPSDFEKRFRFLSAALHGHFERRWKLGPEFLSYFRSLVQRWKRRDVYVGNTQLDDLSKPYHKLVRIMQESSKVIHHASFLKFVRLISSSQCEQGSASP